MQTFQEKERLYAQKCADVNGRQGMLAQTSLMVSAQVGRPAVILRLIELNADVDAKDTNGCTALSLASRMKLLDDLQEYQASTRKTWLVALEDSIAALCQCGADVDARDHRGWGAIHHAAESGSLEALKALLDYGANPDLRANDGTTPAIAAAEGARDRMLHKRVCWLRSELTRMERDLNSHPRHPSIAQQLIINKQKEEYAETHVKIKAVEDDVLKLHKAIDLIG